MISAIIGLHPPQSSVISDSESLRTAKFLKLKLVASIFKGQLDQDNHLNRWKTFSKSPSKLPPFNWRKFRLIDLANSSRAKLQLASRVPSFNSTALSAA